MSGEPNADGNRDPACGWSVITTKMVDLRRHLPDSVAFAHQSQFKRLGAERLRYGHDHF